MSVAVNRCCCRIYQFLYHLPNNITFQMLTISIRLMATESIQQDMSSEIPAITYNISSSITVITVGTNSEFIINSSFQIYSSIVIHFLLTIP